MLRLLTLSWQGCNKLSKLKETLIPALADIDYTWHIKSNGCTDNTIETASTWGDKVKLAKYKDNSQNFSEGMNYLFNLASPQDDDLILFLNNDVSFGDTTSIKKMIDALKDDVGVVGAKLLYPNTNKLQHAGVVFHNNRLPVHFRRHEMDDNNSQKNRVFQAVTGAVMLMKAKDYKAICKTNKSGIDGLCEELVWCFDDIDACLAISHNTKKKIVYCGDTKIFHEESASLKLNPINKLYMQHNVSYFISKWNNKYSVDIFRYSENNQYNLIK